MKRLILFLSVFSALTALAADNVPPPLFKNGSPVYPPPFIGIVRTPYDIGVGATVSDQQIAGMGYRGGFSGFVDQATGRFGYPGYNHWCNLDLGFDDKGLLAILTMPGPYGRVIRQRITASGEDLFSDDVVELLLEPRDEKGESRGIVYRIVGNANGVFEANYDHPGIGQYKQAWVNDVTYRVNPTALGGSGPGSWQAVIYIPFKNLGGAPADGTVWGVQAALRYTDPKITAVLSPADRFEDSGRFAKVRFDCELGAAYRAHWLQVGGDFSVSGLFANSGSPSVTVKLAAAGFKGLQTAGEGSVTHNVPGGAGYSDNLDTPLRTVNKVRFNQEKNSYYRLQAWDESRKKIIYDQYIPSWLPEANERDWLKEHFAREFKFMVGPYPSRNSLDVRVDCQSLLEQNPNADRVRVSVSRNGAVLKTEEFPFEKMTVKGSLEALVKLGDGAMPEGTYGVEAAIVDRAGATISAKMETFARKIFAFETAPKAGLSDMIVAPFTKPKLSRLAVSCWGRTYRHGAEGLFVGLDAAGEDILAEPVRFMAATNGGRPAPLKGGKVTLKTLGQGQTTFAQDFTGAGLKLAVTGVMDYDGFYRFTVAYSPLSEKASIEELYLEAPFKPEHAILHDQAIAGSPAYRDLNPEDIFVGALPQKQGRLWDSTRAKAFYGNWRALNGTMADYLWIGDDERGLAWSMESDAGTHNDDAKSAATLDREGDRVVFRDWLVNQPFELRGERKVEFAFQASPFKPLPDNWRLWREGSRYPYTEKGLSFSSPWVYDGLYHPYGRFLTVDYFRDVRSNILAQVDIMSAAASSCSECGGTPEYQQFWHEWGSPLGWDKQVTAPVDPKLRKLYESLGLEVSPFIGVEAASDNSAANIDYRIWWFNELVKKGGLKAIYQDNPPHAFAYRPESGFGYLRDDGKRQATSTIWQARKYMKRVAHVLAENGVETTPNVFANLCNTALPGRSFSRRVLYGEISTPKIKLDAMRVWFSKQWGYSLAWLLQSPVPGTRADWRQVFSRLLLHDVTGFLRSNYYSMFWMKTLDLFWLDDPKLAWHPYYKNPTLQSVKDPDTFVSTYTKPGRAMLVVSHQGSNSVVEAVRLNDLKEWCGGPIQYFYDAESLERVSLEEGALKLWVGANDYRIILGFAEPWAHAAEALFPGETFPVQSDLNYRSTITDIAQQLLKQPELGTNPARHRLTEFWVSQVIGEIKAVPEQFKFFNAEQCRPLFGDPGIKVSALVKYDKGGRMAYVLAAYGNDTSANRLLPKEVYLDFLSALSGAKERLRYAYPLDPVRGSMADECRIDIPARSGILEFYYWNYQDYGKTNAGPCRIGTTFSRLTTAMVEEVGRHGGK